MKLFLHLITHTKIRKYEKLFIMLVRLQQQNNSNTTQRQKCLKEKSNFIFFLMFLHSLYTYNEIVWKFLLHTWPLRQLTPSKQHWRRMLTREKMQVMQKIVKYLNFLGPFQILYIFVFININNLTKNLFPISTKCKIFSIINSYHSELKIKILLSHIPSIFNCWEVRCLGIHM